MGGMGGRFMRSGRLLAEHGPGPTDPCPGSSMGAGGSHPFSPCRNQVDVCWCILQQHEPVHGLFEKRGVLLFWLIRDTHRLAVPFFLRFADVLSAREVVLAPDAMASISSALADNTIGPI